MRDIVSQAKMSRECKVVTIHMNTATTMQVGSRDGGAELGTDTGRAGMAK